jgi:flagellar hook-associated protein 3 FlgL
MSVGRVTQSMLSHRSLENLQVGLGRLGQLQEQLTSGKTINRPSDSPSGTSSAMRLRTSMTQVQQFQRAAQDGASWLNTVDSALTTATDTVRHARELGLQAVNGAMGQSSRAALAASVDQLREGLIGTANTAYLGRPVFGGVTAGSTAYDASGAYVGEPGAVMRTVGDGTRVRVDVGGQDAFGPDGDSVFHHLDALSLAITSGDDTAIGTALTALAADLDRLGTAQAEAGTRAARVDQAAQVATDAELRMKNDLSAVEDVDLAATVVQLQLQEVAYQAALGATARVLQPSLMEFLR